MRRVVLLSALSLSVLAVPTAPLAAKLDVEDSDLIRPRLARRVRGEFKDEVADFDMGAAKNTDADDYSEFATQTVENAGANKNLKKVSFIEAPQEYKIPALSAEEGGASGGGAALDPASLGRSRPHAPQQQQLYIQQTPTGRTGYYYQHYPYYLLPNNFRMRPGLRYIYPTQYQNAQYNYNVESLKYTDPYGIYRGAGNSGGCGCNSGTCGCPGVHYPQFQPQMVPYSGGCGGGCGGGGCGGGGCGGAGEGDCRDCGGDSDDSYEEGSNERSGERSGEIRNKKDPLEDLSLEDLEKLDKKGSGEERRLKQVKAVSAIRAHKLKLH